MAKTTLDQRMLGVGTALTDHTITASDVITFADVGDSNLTKKDTLQGVLDLAGGAWNIISTQVPDDDSHCEFTSNINSTYNDYVIRYAFLPATDNVELQIQIYTNSAWQTSNYQWIDAKIQTSAGAWSINRSDSGDSAMDIAASPGIGNASTEGIQGHVYFTDPASTSKHTMFQGNATYWDNSGGYSRLDLTTYAGGYNGGTTAVTGVRFAMSSGNITSGRATLYGLAYQ
mgnify:CR=1 FL=1|tara:strand:- start:573 stop:1262 length:690 start_codon:yes stop_codon:yes gene_type:complete